MTLQAWIRIVVSALLTVGGATAAWTQIIRRGGIRVNSLFDFSRLWRLTEGRLLVGRVIVSASAAIRWFRILSLVEVRGGSIIPNWVALFACNGRYAGAP